MGLVGQRHRITGEKLIACLGDEDLLFEFYALSTLLGTDKAFYAHHHAGLEDAVIAD